jgi:hypothetical protein
MKSRICVATRLPRFYYSHLQTSADSKLLVPATCLDLLAMSLLALSLPAACQLGMSGVVVVQLAVFWLVLLAAGSELACSESVVNWSVGV